MFVILNKLSMVYTAPMMCCWFLLLWSLNAMVFRYRRIPYSRIMGVTSECGRLSPRVLMIAALVPTFIFSFALYLWHQYDVAGASLILFAYAVTFGILVCPLRMFGYGHRMWLCENILAVFFPSKNGVTFAQVMIADGFTSLAQVFADMAVFGCFLATSSSHLQHILTDDGHLALEQCTHSLLLPFVTSIPYLLRVRQCILLYQTQPAATASSFPDLWNMGKYLTALPVIWLPTLGRFSATTISTLWFIFIVMNSLFSFSWDVVMDFGLLDVDASTESTTSLIVKKDRGDWANETADTPLVRKGNLGPLPLYLLIVLIDFVLRLMWSLKLGSSFHTNERPLILLLQLLELVRRAIWNMVRVDWEVIKAGPALLIVQI